MSPSLPESLQPLGVPPFPVVDVSAWIFDEADNRVADGEESNLVLERMSKNSEVASALDKAFTEWGFAIVVGYDQLQMDEHHDDTIADDSFAVDSKRCNSCFDAVYDAGKSFFNSKAEKKRIFDKGLGYGYGGYVGHQESGGQLVGEKNIEKKSDGVESLTFRGLHLWSSETQVAGEDIPHFAQDMSDVPYPDPIPDALKASIIDLHNSLLPFKKILVATVEMTLGREIGELAAKDFVPTRGGIRLAYYPDAGPDWVDPDTLRPAKIVKKSDSDIVKNLDYKPAVTYGAHADSGGMVILRLDRNNPVGTEVYYNFNKEDKIAESSPGVWVPVPTNICSTNPRTGATVPGVVLNGGTIMQRLTGGRWKAAIHRAVRKSSGDRLSIVYGAMVPDNGINLCVKDSGKSITVKQYLDARVQMQRPEADPTNRELVDFVDEMGY